MNGNKSDNNGDMAEDAVSVDDDLDNMPCNLARYARSSYSRKVRNYLNVDTLDNKMLCRFTENNASCKNN